MASAASYNDVVQELYVAYFGRPADPLGLTNFTTILAKADPSGSLTSIGALQAAYSTNAAVKSLVDGFGTSAESVALYGSVSATGGINNIYAFVNNIYENLFNRQADVPGLTFWANAIVSGGVTLGDVALSIAAGAAANTTAQGQTDAATVANKIAVSDSFTGGLTSVADLSGYNGTTNPGSISTARSLLTGVTNTTVVSGTAEATAVAGAITTIASGPTGASVTLTTGVDTLTAQNFNAVLASTGSTLNTFDSLTGSAPTGNTLNILSDASTGLPSGITLSNIQTVNFHATGNQSVNLSAETGVTALNITDIGLVATNAAVVAAAGTAVSITGHILSSYDTSGHNGNLTVDGGTNVTISASGSDTAGNALNLGALTIGDTTAPTGAVVVNATNNIKNVGSTASSIEINGGTSVTVNSTINFADANGEAPAHFGQGTISVIGAKGAVIVNSALNFTGNNGDHSNYINDLVDINGGTTVNVNLTATASANVLTTLGGSAYTATHGNVQVLDGGTATSVTINEQVATAAAAVSASAAVPAVVIPAGTGYDAIITTPAQAAVAAAPGVLGISAGNVSISGGSSFSTSSGSASKTITTIALDNYDVANINSAALTSLTLAGTGDGLNLYNVAATPLTLDLNGFTDATGITETGATNTKVLNVVLGADTTDANAGTATAAQSLLGHFADTSLTTLNVSGTGTFALGNIAANTALATIAVTGAAGFTGDVSGLGATLTSFTTTSSGVITAALDAAHQTFVGSTGQDVISINADALKAITGGSAKNNEIILNGDAATFTAAHTVANVTNFTTFGVTGNTAATNEVYNMSVFTGYNSIDVISGSSGAGSDAFTNVATGTSLSIDSSLTGTGPVTAVEGSVAGVSLLYQVANATGASDSLSLTLGNGVTVNDLMLEDANAVGIATLNVALKGSDTIATLTDNGLANLSISGAGSLAINTLNEATTQATAFTINNTTTGGNTSTINNFTDANLGSLVFSGTGNSTVTTLTDSGHLLTVSNTGTGVVNIDTIVDSSLQTLTLSGNVQVGHAATALLPADTTGGAIQTYLGNWAVLSGTNGITIAGATDNVRVNIALAGASAGHTNTITLGNDNNVVFDKTTAGSVVVTVGTGGNLIDLDGIGAASASTYSATVTLGAHTIADEVYAKTVVAGATAANTTITGAAAGDLLVFHDVATSAANATTAQNTTLAASSTLALAIGAADLLATTSHEAFAFQYGGNTFIIESAAAGNGTLTANDSVVELVGLHTVSSTLTTGTVHLTA